MRRPIEFGAFPLNRAKVNPSFLLNAVDPYEMGILFQKALQSRFHLSLVFMDGHMLRQSMSSFS